jgi:hypothetical protein
VSEGTPSGSSATGSSATGSSGRRWTPLALTAATTSWLLLVGTAALGPSAASPALAAGTGWRAHLPPYGLGVGTTSGLVTLLLDAGYLLGGAGVLLGLLAVRAGEPLSRRVLPVALLLAVLTVLVAPVGSADHLSYAAYGRITASGGDAYVVPPITWAGGHDPVTSRVEPPWTTTPSIYGPLAGGVFALASLVGGDSLRATVWVWQLVCLVCWVGVGLVLRRRAGPRGVWLWLANPVLIGVLLLGAHVDLLAAALGLAAVLLAGRRALVAGLLLGAAVAVKLTAALIGPALLWALWRRDGVRSWRAALAGVVGAALVLVPGYLWAGPHAFDQLGRARQFISLATIWRAPVDGLSALLGGTGAVRSVVPYVVPFAVAAVAVALARALARRAATPFPRLSDVSGAAEPGSGADTGLSRGSGGVAADGALAAVVLGAAYVLAAPYSLPWYDALAWAPLPLVAAGSVDLLLLVRLVAYAIAYVPGRVLGSSPLVSDLTLAWRRGVTPVVGAALLVLLVRWARGPKPDQPDRPDRPGRPSSRTAPGAAPPR